MIGEKLRQVTLWREFQHRQIAAVGHMATARTALRDEPSEVRIQLRRATRNVHSGNRRPVQRVEAQRHRLSRHDLSSIRSGIDVAMTAGLITELADIDLEDSD